MSAARQRRVRFFPSDSGHYNYGKTGWAYSAASYDPSARIDEGDSWTFDPDDDSLPNFADPEDFVDVVTDADRDHVVTLLARDVAVTVGLAHERGMRDKAESQREFAEDAEDYLMRVIEDVQQYFHDAYIDTSWPRCPRHGDHPLWLRGHVWTCDRDNVAIADVGALSGEGYDAQ